MPTHWSRVRAALSGLALLGICCRPGPDRFIGVLRIDGDAVESESHATTGLESMLAAIDVDDDGDDELLATSERGLVLVDADRTRTRLSDLGGIDRLERIASTTPSTVDLLVLADLGYEPKLVHLSCTFGDEPRCEQTAALAFEFEYALDFASADFDEDGRIDVVVADGESLLLYRATGSDPSPLASGDGSVVDGSSRWATGLLDVAAADLDGDGHSDLVAVADYPAGMSVVFGTGDGTFEGLTALAAPQDVVYESVRFANLVGDERPDLLAAGYHGVAVFESRGTRELVASWSFTAPEFGSSPTAFVGRFDDQPGNEILLVDESVVPRSRIAAFSAQTSSWTVRDVGDVRQGAYSPWGVVGDLDGDGRDELWSVAWAGIYCE